MIFSKLYQKFNRFELLLWFFSITIVTLSFVISQSSWPNLIAALTGASALMFLSKGHPIGQVLTLIFSLLYAFISYTFDYYGEMITYMGMTFPSALLALITWIRNPQVKGQLTVRVENLSKHVLLIVTGLSVLLTIVFYFILALFETPNLLLSTLSIFTSAMASLFMIYRMSSYAIAYALNDIVLIALWILATIEDITYLPMVICFFIFLINDSYGYYSWNKRYQSQEKEINVAL